jgi:hypothetical protein
LSIITTKPENFMGGAVWPVVQGINNALQGVAYALMVLFFAINMVRAGMELSDMKRLENIVRLLFYLVTTKVLITYSLTIMGGVFSAGLTVINAMTGSVAGGTGGASFTPDTTGGLDAEVLTAIDEMGFLQTIFIMLLALIGMIIIVVLSVVLLLTVYNRFFRIYMYTAIAPVPLSTFVGEATSGAAKAFLKSYAGVCLEGAIIVLACLIYAAYTKSAYFDLLGGADGEAWQIVLGYIIKNIIGMFVLTMIVKSTDRLVKEMFAL